MHKKVGDNKLVERILDHPRNRGRDQGELHQIRKQLGNLSRKGLQNEFRRLGRT